MAAIPYLLTDCPNILRFLKSLTHPFVTILYYKFSFNFQAGKYECGVHTALGSIYATSEIIIHGVPGPPGGVTAHDLQSTDGTIIWTDGTIYGRPIDNYRIEGRTNHDPTWVVLADRLVFKAASANHNFLGISFL